MSPSTAIRGLQSAPDGSEVNVNSSLQPNAEPT